MHNILTGAAITILFLPAIIALAAFGFYTVRYTRLRRARKNTLADYLFDFAGSWARLLTSTDRPEEHRYLRRMLLAAACFVCYVSVLMAVATVPQ
jgi:hypothetical protein